MNMKLSDYLLGVGRPVAYYPKLRRITGSTTATIFLCQFIYWTGKEASGDGWIYKTAEDIEEETGLSYYEQKTAREKLVGSKLISEKNARLEHKMYFKVNLDSLNSQWGTPEPLAPEHDNPSFGNGETPHSLNSNTESTSESTTEEKPILSKERIKTLESLPMDWKIAAGMSDEEVAAAGEKERREYEIACLYESAMGYNPLSWWSDKKLTRLLHFLMDKTPAQIETFATWSKAKYSSLTPVKARQNPDMVIDCWKLAFTEQPASELPWFKADPHEGEYVVK